MKYQRVALTLLVSVAGLIFVTGAPRASALRSNGAVSGAENKLWDCEKRNVGFGLDKTGGAEQNVLRCFTHTFSVPPEGITSAVLKMDILAAGDSDTDEVVIATAKRNLPNGQSLECPNGGMAGCVTLRHGLQAASRSLTLNLLDVGCDPTIQKGDLTERQGAVRAALQTGVVHFMLQDPRRKRFRPTALLTIEAIPPGRLASGHPQWGQLARRLAGQGTRNARRRLDGCRPADQRRVGRGRSRRPRRLDRRQGVEALNETAAKLRPFGPQPACCAFVTDGLSPSRPPPDARIALSPTFLPRTCSRHRVRRSTTSPNDRKKHGDGPDGLDGLAVLP